MNIITPVENTNNIRYADFVRVTTGTLAEPVVYRFSTAPFPITIPEIDAEPFDGLGALVSIGNATRDIKSTANETSITLVGIDTALLGWVLGHNIKGSKVEMWHGFFDENNQLIDDNAYGGLYQFFMGYISSFAISEQWDEDGKSFLGTISISCSSVQLILQNRTAGRFTNDNAWQFFNPGDTSMSRVAFIQSLNYPFGKDAPNNS